ncbi:MAG: gamma-glutamyltransferase family protein [Spirochaetales bacterium]|nr:gamma-glutamyltransferase family protein [Spirochaetales bacterium]
MDTIPGDERNYRFPSRRTVVYGARGMACASQPLAAQAGLEVLRRGGNAVDAAVAMAAALTVVEPTSNGIGGDAFALVWAGGRLYALNGSGPAPRSLSLESLGRDETGRLRIDPHGWESVTVPGAPAAWAALSKRFGRLPFAELFREAVAYAREGYPVSPVVARYWDRAVRAWLPKLRDTRYERWFELFAPGGRAPAAGEPWRSEAHARTLEEIAATGAESFYRGALAKRLVAFSRATGGFLSESDLEAFEAEWTEPVSVEYRGVRVHECPPNGQGLVALMALGMLAADDFSAIDPVEGAHRRIEALKLAFADARARLADPAAMALPAEAFLDPAYLSSRRALIGERASLPEPGTPPRGGTVYLAAADREGGMVSYIQSNYMGFGTGLVVPETGIALHNRGCNFSTEAGHPNALAGGRRPYHTIMPGFLTRNGAALGPFGVMGGFMQPQGHLQVVSNLLDVGMNAQEALDAPRFQWLEGRRVVFEEAFEPERVEALAARGHEVDRESDPGSFGRGQIILRDGAGVLHGATEPRADGCVAAY